MISNIRLSKIKKTVLLGMCINRENYKKGHSTALVSMEPGHGIATYIDDCIVESLLHREAGNEVTCVLHIATGAAELREAQRRAVQQHLAPRRHAAGYHIQKSPLATACKLFRILMLRQHFENL